MIELKWDGSYLGEFPRSAIKSKLRVYNQPVITQIDDCKLSFYGVLKSHRDTTLSCVLDELKTCFSLPKIGTHRLKLGSRNYMIYRCYLSDTPMTKTSNRGIYKKDMQKLICYRSLFSIPNTTNSTFLTRGDEVYSFNETRSYLDQSITEEPTDTFLREWFDDDFHQHMLKLLPSEVHLIDFGHELEKAIKRIDSNYVWMIPLLLEKMSKLKELIVPSNTEYYYM
jgi:hypothetical protein